MFFNGYQGGRCPAGDRHSAQGLIFALPYGVPATDTAQANWRFCLSCNVMFFDGYAGGRCPAGGPHIAQGINFVLPHDVAAAPTAQANWRFCQKCNAMFYDGYPDKGTCPAGGGHAAQGFNFNLPIQQAPAATASQAGKAVFASMDQCGIAALDEILNRSISEGAEYAGLIFKQGDSFGFTAPTRGEPDSALPMLIVPTGDASPDDIQAAIQQAIDKAKRLVPAGADPVGTYHTHGNAQGSGEIFSPQDRGFHNLRHWFAYLGTPSGVILKFTPKERPADEAPAWAAFGGKVEKLR
jgi:hypothetical protein